jgi:hypothetical protein
MYHLMTMTSDIASDGKMTTTLVVQNVSSDDTTAMTLVIFSLTTSSSPGHPHARTNIHRIINSLISIHSAC